MLTKKQEHVLIGSLLGDTHIEYNGAKRCRVRFDHTLYQFEYLQWKHQMFQPFSGPIKRYTVYDKRTQKSYEKARTCTHPIFNSFRETFYQERKKIVPAAIQSIFHSKLALAVWYLDDGSLKTDCKAFKFHTNSFTTAEVQLLQECLQLNFGRKSKLHKQKNCFVLYIGNTGFQAQKLRDAIKPLVESEIPSMLYKFF